MKGEKVAQNSKVKDIMADLQSVKADDPDMIKKLNEIAQKVAEAQGKAQASSKSQVGSFNNLDPMDELGCEGCQ